MQYWLGNDCKPGNVVPVKPVAGGYPLRDGLKHGDCVRLISFDSGYWTAEFEGRQVKVFMMSIDLPCVPRGG